MPGDRPGRFVKVAAAGTDAVIFDLGDAVAVADKGIARARLGALLDGGGRGAVRTSPPSTPWSGGC